MHRLGLAMPMVLAGLVAAGCGGGGTKSATTSGTTAAKAPAGDASAVRKAIANWGHSDTPQEVCALMSARVKRGLLASDADACRNKKKLEAALGVQLESTELKATKIKVTGEQAVADTEAPVPEKNSPPERRRYHLVKEAGSWKVDSIDQPGTGAAAPSS